MRINEIITEDEDTIVLKPKDNSRALNWIKRVYERFPQTWDNNHVMIWGEGEDQQLAMFELVPSLSKRDGVEVKWFSAYPLRQGVGSRAMRVLQDMAREDGIVLTLFPWGKGQISQAKLTKFYRGHGFTPAVKGSKNLVWEPQGK
jgi:GNAT superfamily N-acetyltransferase